MITHIIKYSMGLSLLSALLYWAFTADIRVAGLVVGTAWGCANLYLLSCLGKCILITKKTLATGLFLAIKFPLLYGIGYLILSTNLWNPFVLLGGFTMIFVGMAVSLPLQLRRRSA